MYALTVRCLIWRNKRVLPSRKRWPSLCLFGGHGDGFNGLVLRNSPAVARDVASFVSDVSPFAVSCDEINQLEEWKPPLSICALRRYTKMRQEPRYPDAMKQSRITARLGCEETEDRRTQMRCLQGRVRIEVHFKCSPISQKITS